MEHIRLSDSTMFNCKFVYDDGDVSYQGVLGQKGYVTVSCTKFGVRLHLIDNANNSLTFNFYGLRINEDAACKLAGMVNNVVSYYVSDDKSSVLENLHHLGGIDELDIDSIVYYNAKKEKFIHVR